MEWNLTGGRKLLIGMIHCLPLPGTYGATATIDEVIARAVSDAKALERVGFDAVMIENEDLCLEPHMTKVQFSAISMVAQAVRSAVKLPLGLCCSGLNYEEALSIAKVVGGDFIRTPIFVDTVMNYNGIMTPCSGKSFVTAVRSARSMSRFSRMCRSNTITWSILRWTLQPLQSGRSIRGQMR